MYFNISTKKSPLFKGTHLPHFTTTSIPQPRDPKPCETMGNPNAGLFVFSPKILRWPTVAMKFKLASLVFDPRRLSREYRSKHFWRLQIYDFLHFFLGGWGHQRIYKQKSCAIYTSWWHFFFGSLARRDSQLIIGNELNTLQASPKPQKSQTRKQAKRGMVFCSETHVLRVIRPLKRTHLQSIHTLSGIKECNILSTLELGAAFLLNLETFLTRLAQVTLLEGGWYGDWCLDFFPLMEYHNFCRVKYDGTDKDLGKCVVRRKLNCI